MRKDSDVLYANPLLLYSDGTLEGLTNQLIVRLKTSTNIDSLSLKFKQLKVTGIDKSKYIDREYLLTIDTKQQLDALDVADTLFETGLFDYCEPDFVKLGIFKTNDPVYNLQWGVHNTGQYNGTPNADVNVVNAWNIATGTGIKVAVIDEGVDLNQPDLQANLLTGYDALGLGSNGGPTGDDAHGTACAGIIAAVANNNIGVTGIAYNSKIIPIRVGTEAGGISNSVAANAINWASSANGGNADILSCSWGGGSSSSSLNTAIANAISNGRGGKGCIVLFSTGNDNNATISYPSSQPNVIAVGGTNPCDQRFVITPTTPTNSCNYDTRLNTVTLNAGSNYGTGLGVVAPGINIATTDISGAAGFSNHTFDEGWIMFNQDYVENFDGTSAACPFTAGVMALILSVNSNLTYSQATAILESTADKVGGYNYSTNLTNGTWNNEMGYGRVNACAAVSATLATLTISGDNNFCTTSNNYSITNLPAGATVTWSATPSGIATINSPNSTQTTLTKISDGLITLTATITNACNGNITINKSNIDVGGPIVDFTLQPFQPGQQFCTNALGNTIEITPQSIPNVTGFQWGYSSYQNNIPPTVVMDPGTYQQDFFFSVGGNYQIYARPENGCGLGNTQTLDIYVNDNCTGGGGLNANSVMVAPNPTSGDVQVSTTDQKTTIKEIRVLDKIGNVKKSFIYKVKTGSVKIDLSSLPADVYYLQISDGTKSVTKSIIKQ